MKIWFDLSNSPHINMFAALIRELQADHEVVITCRPLANTVDLLELHRLSYTVVGRHYGKALIAKILGFPVRVWELLRFLRPRRIDVAVSQSSFHSPLVARLLGVRSIYMNDNEHAMGNIPAFVFANRILVPEFLSLPLLRRQGAHPRKVHHYPGVKEGMYLWELDRRLNMAANDAQAACAKPPKRRKSIYIRPEPWTAQYYQGSPHFLDDLLRGLAPFADVTLLPRGRAQAEHYRKAEFGAIRIVDSALDIADIAPDCDLFIGAGGTMTREMAVLGIPTISVYQGELLAVDRYLLEQQAFVHRPDLSAADALAYLNSTARQPPNRGLLDKGRQAYEMIRQEILGTQPVGGPVT